MTKYYLRENYAEWFECSEKDFFEVAPEGVQRQFLRPKMNITIEGIIVPDGEDEKEYLY